MVSPKDFVPAVKKDKQGKLIGTALSYDDFTAIVDGQRISTFSSEVSFAVS